ncbi:NAD(+) diphosphatase [Pseudoxanthomonas kalamensis DSM 18571]|uniref:NAD(+) diphosphatase n=1 Tax=Pseudoxanthomonas kalamensis TaxID=289483 RepID=UPI0013914164|nr:NAD(+) diphosphatase [Pseudoxanthomonas kalamensis]KAF1712617.1 NAD(+) diphosphatase [Pseudoxanthomonas kalamensis DSM 18571]
MSAATDARVSGFAFVDDPLDRADLLRGDAEALRRLWPQARVLCLDAEGRARADAQGQPMPRTGAQAGAGPEGAIFLGLDGEQAWFAQAGDAADAETPGVDLRQAGATWPAREAGVFALARALLHWQSRTRFCGVCGGGVRFERAGYLGRCTQCHAEHYPRVDPAVIAAVSDGRRLLLGRKAEWPARRYSLIAGFVEPGETLEQTVAREVMEETGVRVRRSRYLASQPWPFPGALMLGFEALAEPDPPRLEDELEDVRWFEREQVGAALERGGEDAPLRLPPRLSIARALVERWYRHGPMPA